MLTMKRSSEDRKTPAETMLKTFRGEIVDVRRVDGDR